MRLRLLAILALWPAIATAAPCPTTRYSIYSTEGTSAEPTGGVSGTNPQYPYIGDSTLNWNAPAGWVRVYGYSSGTHGWAGGSVTSTDTFELVGAPPGTSVRVTATFNVYGYTFCSWPYCNYIGGSLTDALGRAGSVVLNSPDVRRLELPVDLVAGTPLALSYQVDGSSGGLGVEAQGWLSFPDLPSHLSIVSCRGFQSGAITPARSSSWGGAQEAVPLTSSDRPARSRGTRLAVPMRQERRPARFPLTSEPWRA